jgi:hypothetical protein
MVIYQSGRQTESPTWIIHLTTPDLSITKQHLTLHGKPTVHLFTLDTRCSMPPARQTQTVASVVVKILADMLSHARPKLKQPKQVLLFAHFVVTMVPSVALAKQVDTTVEQLRALLVKQDSPVLLEVLAMIALLEPIPVQEHFVLTVLKEHPVQKAAATATPAQVDDI